MKKDKKQEILDYLEKAGVSRSKQLCEKLAISRQALNVHIRELISNGRIVKTGATRSARYYLSESAPKPEKYKKTVQLANLDESAVYEELATTPRSRISNSIFAASRLTNISHLSALE